MSSSPGLGNGKTPADSLAELYHNAGAPTSTSEEQQIETSRRFLKWLLRPLLTQMGISAETQDPLVWLDVACGPGVATQELHDMLSRRTLERSSFLSTDSSAALVQLVNKRIRVEGWINTHAQVLDAMDTRLPDGIFTHVTVAMGLHIIPQPDRALEDCQRILRQGGVLGLTTPHNDEAHSMWQPDLRSAFASFPFDAPFPQDLPTQMHSHGNWADAEWVGKHLKDKGFKDVQSGIVRATHHVESADAFLQTFGGMLMWVMNSWWPEETRAEHGLDEVKALTRCHLEEKYNGDGWDIRWAIVCATAKAA